MSFIKSEYAQAVGIKVEKNYTDTNGGVLQAGDEVDVSVTMTNISGSRKNNLIY